MWRRERQTGGGQVESSKSYQVSTVPQLSLICCDGSVTCVTTSSTTVSRSCHVLLMSGDRKLSPTSPPVSGHIGAGPEAWPPSWEVTFYSLIGGCKLSVKTGEQKCPEPRMKGIHEECQLLISSQSGTSAAVQTWSKCFPLYLIKCDILLWNINTTLLQAFKSKPTTQQSTNKLSYRKQIFFSFSFLEETVTFTVFV